MKTDEFDYQLPDGRIAQQPAEPRENAKLMIVDRKQNSITHAHVSDLPDYLSQNDLLVVNNSKVFKARLHAQPQGLNSGVELFLIRPRENVWIALGKPGKKLAKGMRLDIATDFHGTITDKLPDGSLLIDFGRNPSDVITLADTYGRTPLPPYITSDADLSVYQTAYAKHVGSVAAPTAGFHLTNELLHILEKKGIGRTDITLHVGLGTFRPIRSREIHDHAMHSEWVDIRETSATTIREAMEQKKRIVAIGTTTVRTLEGVAALKNNIIFPYTGDVNIFITPGFRFNVVDAMLTNFHLPKSTLLVLVSAFAGMDLIRQAYRQAIEHNYRFYSFGDAMLIL